MSETHIAFISGVVATSIGFGLAVLWDVYKWNRDTGARDVAVMSALNDDLEANLSLIEMNESILLAEMEVLKEKKSVVRPLQTLREGFWDVAKFNLPKKLVENANALKTLKDISKETSYTNEVIRSRESWRANNSAMSNFESRLEIYNSDLLGLFKSLKALTEDEIKEIK